MFYGQVKKRIFVLQDAGGCALLAVSLKGPPRAAGFRALQILTLVHPTQRERERVRKRERKRKGGREGERERERARERARERE